MIGWILIAFFILGEGLGLYLSNSSKRKISDLGERLMLFVLIISFAGFASLQVYESNKDAAILNKICQDNGYEKYRSKTLPNDEITLKDKSYIRCCTNEFNEDQSAVIENCKYVEKTK